MKENEKPGYESLNRVMKRNDVFILDYHNRMFCLADCQLKLTLVSLMLGCYDNLKILP